MSRSTDRRAARPDAGFTLLEVVVSLGVLVVLLTALLPQLVVGIRSTATAQTITQAKGVAQGQLERMRSMPYHVGRAAGPYLDVLDRYYTDLDPAPEVTCESGDDYVAPEFDWRGYVLDTPRCDYEPQSGPFYRYVVPHPATGPDPIAGFEVVVATQFLDGATPPGVVTPVADYDTQTAGRDRPASSQIGVTVTVLQPRGATLRPVTTYTQIADLPEEVARVRVSADATAIEIGSVLDAQGAVSLEAGLLDLSGSLAFASDAGADLASVSAGLATGDQQSGAAATVSAPSAAALQPGAAGCLLTLACWGSSQLDLAATSAASGLPTVGSATSPMQARVTDTALTFDIGAPAGHRPRLQLPGPLVRMATSATASATGLTTSCAPGTTGMPAYARSSGFLRTTPPADPISPSTVEACALSSASTIALFPTSFAPNGVVQVDLEHASARCVVSGVTHTAQAPAVDYRAVVRYHVGSGPDSYAVAAVITPSMTDDQLAAVDLSVDVDGDLGKRTLGDYVATWSGLVASGVERTSLGGVSAVRLPGVVHITSTPMRGTEVPAPEITPTPSPSESPSPSPSDGPTEEPTTEPTTEPTIEPTEVPEPAEVIDATSSFTFSAGIVGCSAQDAR